MVEPVDVKIRVVGVDQFMNDINKTKTMLSKGFKEIENVISDVNVEMKELSKKGSKQLISGLLGVMFAGMLVERMFGGLTKELKKFGIEQAFTVIQMSLIMAQLQSPIFNTFRKTLWNLTKIFMNLPQGLREAIGGGQIFIAFLGGLVTKLGSAGLAILGLQALFPALLPKIGAFISVAFKGLISLLPTLGLIAAALLALVVIFKLVFDKEFRNTIRNAGRRFGDFVFELGQSWGDFVFESGKNFGSWLRNIRSGLGIILENIKRDFNEKINSIKNFFIQKWDNIKNKVAEVANWIKNKMKGVWDFVKDVFRKPFEIGFKLLTSGISGLTRGLRRLIEFVLERVGFEAGESFQLGGRVRKTGLAVVHKGEQVIPATKVSSGGVFAPNITINASVSSDMDIDHLARRVNDIFERDFISRAI